VTYKPRRKLIDTGIVATLLLLSAIGACTFAQHSQEPASPAQAPVASDAELAVRVKAALRAAPDVNDIHIDVTIENGNVVLTGLVEDNRALLDALHVAKEAAGGRKVIDALSIMKISAH
jgi:osmotically-inducible protein OsmY